MRCERDPERLVTRLTDGPVELDGTSPGWRAAVYANAIDGRQFLALYKGNTTSPEPILCRVHGGSTFADLFASTPKERWRPQPARDGRRDRCRWSRYYSVCSIAQQKRCRERPELQSRTAMGGNRPNAGTVEGSACRPVARIRGLNVLCGKPSRSKYLRQTASLYLIGEWRENESTPSREALAKRRSTLSTWVSCIK